MKVVVTKEMIDEAISNVDRKLRLGNQKKKVYQKNSKEDTYYMNNIVGELGELVFKKALIDEGYELGRDLEEFGTFKNSDVGDFITSKTGQSIDIKTVSRATNTSLMVNKRITNWRTSSYYVLVKLWPTVKRDVSIDSLYDITYGFIQGFVHYKDLQKKENIVTMYGDEVYLLKKSQLLPISNLLERDFFKKEEKINKYYSKDKIEFHIASIEEGSINEDEDIDTLAEKYDKKGRNDGHYNFKNIYLKEKNKIVSFAIFRGKLNVALLSRALLSAEAKARQSKCTLVIPDYIERQLSEEEKLRIVELVRDMRCNLEFAWSTEQY